LGAPGFDAAEKRLVRAGADAAGDGWSWSARPWTIVSITRWPDAAVAGDSPPAVPASWLSTRFLAVVRIIQGAGV